MHLLRVHGMVFMTALVFIVNSLQVLQNQLQHSTSNTYGPGYSTNACSTWDVDAWLFQIADQIDGHHTATGPAQSCRNPVVLQETVRLPLPELSFDEFPSSSNQRSRNSESSEHVTPTFATFLELMMMMLMMMRLLQITGQSCTVVKNAKEQNYQKGALPALTSVKQTTETREGMAVS